ncbi:MAG: electron transport complex subunit RsxA [Nitrospirae bacterium]|nr:electron transport complex subunit RsxA [Nitrospirota bacterium]
MDLMLLFIGTVLVNNFVLAKMLGLCPFVGVSRSVENSIGMGMAVVFVIFLASVSGWFMDRYVLTPYGITYLRTLVFILLIAALVQLVETVMRKSFPALYRALGIYLPLITTNCVVLGTVILIMNKRFSLVEMLIYGLGSPIGFYVALFLISSIREQLALAKIPRAFQGAGIALITTGILALAFMGFSGMVRE